jgi:hypothetical protein
MHVGRLQELVEPAAQHRIPVGIDCDLYPPSGAADTWGSTSAAQRLDADLRMRPIAQGGDRGAVDDHRGTLVIGKIVASRVRASALQLGSASGTL